MTIYLSPGGCLVAEALEDGAAGNAELRTAPVPYWLVCFSDTVKGSIREMVFPVVLPDGRVVEPRAAERL